MYDLSPLLREDPWIGSGSHLLAHKFQLGFLKHESKRGLVAVPDPLRPPPDVLSFMVALPVILRNGELC